MSSSWNSKQRKHFPIDHRPRMLKDFLVDESNLCSPSGVKTFPRRVQESSVRNLIQNDLKTTNKASSYSSNTKRSMRSGSKAAASTTISALQAIINSVKSIQFNVVKSPSILPRAISRKLSRKNSNKSESEETDIKITVTVKDIIRWKSFGDLIEEKPQPSDVASSPDHHCTTTTTTTTTGSINSTPCNSNGSSWCDSDFTSEYLPWRRGISEGHDEQELELGKRCLPCVGKESMKSTTEAAINTAVGPQEFPCEEKEQRSPISVLDAEVKEDKDSPLSFDQTLANMEKTKQNFMQKIQCSENVAKIDPTNLEQWMAMEDSDTDNGYGDDKDEEINEVEDMAKLLLNHVKAIFPIWFQKDSILLEQLLLDFFGDELSTSRNQSKIDDIDSKILRRSIAWMKGEHSTKLIRREACVRDMDRKESWIKFEDEEEQVALQIENLLLNGLVDEILADLLGHNSCP